MLTYQNILAVHGRRSRRAVRKLKKPGRLKRSVYPELSEELPTLKITYAMRISDVKRNVLQRPNLIDSMPKTVCA